MKQHSIIIQHQCTEQSREHFTRLGDEIRRYTLVRKTEGRSFLCGMSRGIEEDTWLGHISIASEHDDLIVDMTRHIIAIRNAIFKSNKALSIYINLELNNG